MYVYIYSGTRFNFDFLNDMARLGRPGTNVGALYLIGWLLGQIKRSYSRVRLEGEEYKERVRRRLVNIVARGKEAPRGPAMDYHLSKQIPCYRAGHHEVTTVAFDLQEELLWTGTSGVRNVVDAPGPCA